MENKFGIVTAEHCYLRQAQGANERENETGIEDEIFSGWAVRAVSEEENGWVKIETHYGYTGYVRNSEIRWISKEALQERQDKSRFLRMGVGEADLLSIPKVQGLPRELILKNAIVELLKEEKTEAEASEDGWSLVRTAAGKEGYVHTKYLLERKEDDGYLLEEAPAKNYFKEKYANPAEKEVFRQGVTKSAKAFLGTQYRWGGKSSQGIDCSGLAFTSYMENGVLIYRDVNILEEYAVREISKEELKPADLIFFPGHVAIYLGEGKFIHSTAYAKTPCVTINSLRPEDEDYREDLANQITACGTIF